jgi:tetratricopeptide (TPR) repeat protein
MLADARENLERDLENAIRYARTETQGLTIAFDLAFLTGDWSRLPSMLDEMVKTGDCARPSWLDTYAFAFGMADDAIILLEKRLECDPMSYPGWSNMAQAVIWSGDPDSAIEIARRGLRTVPHTRIKEALINAFISAGHFDDAEAYINSEFRDARRVFQTRMALAAARGDAREVARLLESYGPSIEDTDLAGMAASGNRDLANEMAGRVDTQPYGYLRLMTAVMTCYCGAPFDLEATPDFARRIDEGGLPWPPGSPTKWPLKDW